MQVEWDPKKAAINRRDHKVTFEEAATALEDEFSLKLRSEYRREDFGPMVRGKYAARLRETSNIIILDPEIAEAFPNAQAVNKALRGLLELLKANACPPPQAISAPA
jgi:uncharacterized DUF497 family protein